MSLAKKRVHFCLNTGLSKDQISQLTKRVNNLIGVERVHTLDEDELDPSLHPLYFADLYPNANVPATIALILQMDGVKYVK